MCVCIVVTLMGLSPEILIIIIIGALILFGGRKIPELMRGIGAVREFKAGLDEEVDPLVNHRDCLIVTPDRSLRKMISATARRLFRRTATAADRESVERALRSVQPLIAIVDLDLPNFEGFYLIPFIKNTTGASVIALSSVEDEERPWKSGVGTTDGYLVKPFTQEQLLSLIHEVLDRRNRPPSEKPPSERRSVKEMATP